jgi:hypothetical protein
MAKRQRDHWRLHALYRSTMNVKVLEYEQIQNSRKFDYDIYS